VFRIYLTTIMIGTAVHDVYHQQCVVYETFIMPPPHRAEALSDALSDVCLTSICLSVAYIGPNSRTERPRKPKNGRGSPRHVIRTPLSRSKGQRSNFADVLSSQHAGAGATWRLNTKILSTCNMHIVCSVCCFIYYFNYISFAIRLSGRKVAIKLID